MHGASCTPSTLQLSPSTPPVGERRDILRPLLEAERAHDEDKVWHSGARVHIRAGNRAVRAPFFSAERLTLVGSSGAGAKDPNRRRSFRARGTEVPDDPHANSGEYLRPGEAAASLHVSPQTIRRWASQGMLPFALTAGGHRRFPRIEVERLREKLDAEANQAPTRER